LGKRNTYAVIHSHDLTRFMTDAGRPCVHDEHCVTVLVAKLQRELEQVGLDRDGVVQPRRPAMLLGGFKRDEVTRTQLVVCGEAIEVSSSSSSS
jgi:hypothetical protein